jgi:hypothetical protein
MGCFSPQSANTYKVDFQIQNEGDAPFTLDGARVRYYFTNDMAPMLVADVDFAEIGGGVFESLMVRGACTTMPAKPGANGYCEYTFPMLQGAVIPAGGHALVRSRIHDPAYVFQFYPEDDYSYDGTKTAMTAWDHITLYSEGRLIWGVEP